MTDRVVALRRPKSTPRPPAPAYAQVPQEARAAADTLVRRAAGIQRALGVSFATASSVAQVPALIREARAALAELEELVG